MDCSSTPLVEQRLTRVDPATGYIKFWPGLPHHCRGGSHGLSGGVFPGDPRHTFRPHQCSSSSIPLQGMRSTIVTSRGPALQFINSIAVEPTGTFMVVGSVLKAVARISEQTGEQTIVSDATTGSGPPFQQLGNIAVEATGELVTVDPVRNAVLRINPVTGVRTIVSDASLGVGRPFRPPQKLRLNQRALGGHGYQGSGTVVRVDPVGGDRADHLKVVRAGQAPPEAQSWALFMSASQ